MSLVEQIRDRAEALMAAGEFDREAILDEVVDMVEMDVEAMKRSLAKRRLSLAIATIRNDEGERMAFTARDSEGRPVFVHMEHSRDYKAMAALAMRKRRHAYRELHEADRLFERSHQLSLFERTEEDAA